LLTWVLSQYRKISSSTMGHPVLHHPLNTGVMNHLQITFIHKEAHLISAFSTPGGRCVLPSSTLASL
jgi:hypothetical protein